MRRMPTWCAVLSLGLGLVGASRAADIPIAGLKLIVVDKIASANSAKTVFVATDPNITKGPGTDPTQISATLNIAYDGAHGTFTMPPGAQWLVNSPTVSKYVNKSAPTGGAVKVGVIKPGALLRVVAKGLGDVPLRISTVPVGPVYAVDTIVNGGEETRLCTQFTECVHKMIAGDTGYKLVCKGTSAGDPACTAAAVPPTTSTSVPTTTTTTLASSTTTTTLTGSVLNMARTAVGGTPTGVAAAEVFLAPTFSAGYVNVVADLDRDGLEADADPTNGGDWWVRNFPVVLHPSSMVGSVAFSFALGSVTPSGAYDVYASFTDSQTAAPSLDAMVLTSDVPFGVFDIGDLQSGVANGFIAGAVPRSPLESGLEQASITRRAVGWSRRALDAFSVWVVAPTEAATCSNFGDLGWIRLDMPGILQGKNECGPTSAAQSLYWLERQGLQGLPPQDELIDRLKKAMNPEWDENGTYPGIGGVADFVRGKNEVAQALGLAITTTVDARPTFDFILSKLQANADVELIIDYPDPAGAHMVTVAGWYDNGMTKSLCFKDPLTPGQTVDCYKLDDDAIEDYKYGDGTIWAAVAESITGCGGPCPTGTICCQSQPHSTAMRCMTPCHYSLDGVHGDEVVECPLCMTDCAHGLACRTSNNGDPAHAICRAGHCYEGYRLPGNLCVP